MSAMERTEKALTTVLDDVARVVRDITPQQYAMPTPCPELDVRTLRRHLLGWLHLFDTALNDPAGEQRPAPAEHPEPASAADAAAQVDRLAATVRAALASGVEGVTVNVPPLGGAYPGSVVLDMLLIEALGHGWDLARATGRSWAPEAATSEHALAALRQIVAPEYRGDGLPFGPEVPVSDDASALDRFVAFTGRNPQWSSAL
jgi:uncharacterized protein (TIGR03086 family)